MSPAYLAAVNPDLLIQNNTNTLRLNVYVKQCTDLKAAQKHLNKVVGKIYFEETYAGFSKNTQLF